MCASADEPRLNEIHLKAHHARVTRYGGASDTNASLKISQHMRIKIARVTVFVAPPTFG
jgi:hypothetical protein